MFMKHSTDNRASVLIDNKLKTKCNTLIEQCLKDSKHTCCLVQFLGSIDYSIIRSKTGELDLEDAITDYVDFYSKSLLDATDKGSSRSYYNMLRFATNPKIVEGETKELYAIVNKKYKKRILKLMNEEGLNNFYRLLQIINTIDVRYIDSDNHKIVV